MIMFERGEQKQMAEAAGMSEQQLSLYVNKKAVIGYKVAKRLEEAGKTVGLNISFERWMEKDF